MKAERLPSKHNDYEHLTDWMIEGVRTPYALRIWCHQCGRNEVIPLRGGVHTVQQSLADKMFQRHGWLIGRRRKFDTCPDCVQRERDERNARRIAAEVRPTIADVWPTKKETNVVELKAIPMIAAPQPVIDEPRTMTRLDKRIIFSRLEEVYVDEHTGYSSGWSDQRVATELGIPLDWVRTLRDENFGPEGHSPEAKALFEEARKLLEQARGEREALLAKTNELTAQAAKLALEIDRIERKLIQVERGKL
jgi:hypothetical protein